MKRYFSAASLFSAGLFCLVLAMFFGVKLIAAGQMLVSVSIVIAFLEDGRRTLQWSELGSSAKWLGFYLLVAAISVLANLDLIEGPLQQVLKVRHLALVLLILLIPRLAWKNLTEVWRRDSLVLAWFIPLVLALAFSLSNLVAGEDLFRSQPVVDPRISGFYGQVMTFANTLQFTVITLAIMLFSPRWWSKLTRVHYWVMVTILFVAGIGLYLTYTRGAMLGVITGYTIYALMRSYKLMILIVILGIIGGIFSSFDGGRYLRIKSPLRESHWRAASLAFLERPVWGYGYRNFEPHSAELKERYHFDKDRVHLPGRDVQVIHAAGHAHNNVLEAFASMGVFGGIAFLGFCLAWVREMWRSRYASLFVPLIGAFFVAGLFEDTFYDSEVLNCILLIYLMSQWTLRYEKRGNQLSTGREAEGV